MLIKLFLFIFILSLSIESPPNNCKVCQGFIFKFQQLKTKEQKIEKINENCNADAIHVFPFEDGLCEWD